MQICITWKAFKNNGAWAPCQTNQIWMAMSRSKHCMVEKLPGWFQCALRVEKSLFQSICCSELIFFLLPFILNYLPLPTPPHLISVCSIFSLLCSTPLCCISSWSILFECIPMRLIGWMIQLHKKYLWKAHCISDAWLGRADNSRKQEGAKFCCRGIREINQ